MTEPCCACGNPTAVASQTECGECCERCCENCMTTAGLCPDCEAYWEADEHYEPPDSHEMMEANDE